MMRIDRPSRPGSLVAIAAAFLLLSCGCEKRLETGYGRASGPDHTTSVNGTIVFQQMVKATGRDVDRYSRISPRWQQYKTVYWFPDGYAAPDQETIDRIEQWLAADHRRTLVVVGRDFDAEVLYRELLRKNLSEDPGREFERDLADATSRYLSASDNSAERECAWYQTETFVPSQVTELSGELSEGIDASRSELRYHSLPLPGELNSDGLYHDYNVEILLEVDSIPFCYSLRKDNWPQSRIVVVGNGSFLLNLPLSIEENRKLANSLIQHVHQNETGMSDVLFIESGAQIAYSEQDKEAHHSRWMWITRRPLRYIVPNILFWCLLLCFVYFPIFGRPGRIKRRSTADFRDHILALAQLMSQTGSRREPDSWIEEYRRRTARHTGGPGEEPIRTDEKNGS